MREDFIREEVKKGNPDARARAARIDMLPPPTKEAAASVYDRRGQQRDRSRSKSKSKSPSPEARGGAQVPGGPPAYETKDSKSRLDLFATDVDGQSNYSGNVNRLLYP